MALDRTDTGIFIEYWAAALTSKTRCGSFDKLCLAGSVGGVFHDESCEDAIIGEERDWKSCRIWSEQASGFIEGRLDLMVRRAKAAQGSAGPQFRVRVFEDWVFADLCGVESHKLTYRYIGRPYLKTYHSLGMMWPKR